MVKAYVCRAAEWVTREAMQLHGGMGYAEEFPVSRYFVDARVLSIFEGADETLCLRVIARRLAEQALEAPGRTAWNGRRSDASCDARSACVRRQALRVMPARSPRVTNLMRHLAARLVDHLVAEHHRALAVALGRRLLVGLEDVERAVELLLASA